MVAGRAVSAAVVVALTFSSVASAATISVSGGCGNQSWSSTDDGLWSASATIPESNDAQAKGEASPGKLHLLVQAWGRSNDVLCRAQGSGQTAENIFIDAPFLGHGSATIVVRAEGGVTTLNEPTGSVYSNAGVTWRVEFGGTARGGSEGSVARFDQLTRTQTGDALGTYTFTVGVDFDTWVPLSISAAAVVGTFDYGALSGFFYPGWAMGLADFHDTFEFVGITELRDAAGNLVDFSAIGESGRNYRVAPIAIAEPASGGLAALALAALVAAGRRAGSRYEIHA